MKRVPDRTFTVITLILVIAALAVLWPAGQVEAAVRRSLVEEFTTTTYKDPVNTTADWNTAVGQLQLFPFTATTVGTLDTPGYPLEITVDGDYAYLADGPSGVQIIDIRNPAAPVILGAFNTSGTTAAVFPSGDFVFVADQSAGLQILSVANPAAPTLLGTFNTAGTAVDVAVAGDHAYIADDTFGVQIINVANPAAPALLGTFNTAGNATSVAVSGDFVYVADGLTGLIILDVTNPAVPVQVGSVNTVGIAKGVAVSGNIACVADGTGGLAVIDVSNPAIPVQLGTRLTRDAEDVIMLGERAYVADDLDGLRIIDISNPANPVWVRQINTPGVAQGVDVAGDLAFVADGSTGGLQVIRIRDHLLNLTQAGGLALTQALGVDVAGTFVYVADGSAGLQVIDVSNPAVPVVRGTLNTSGTSGGVTVAGKYAYVADGASGLVIANISNPASPVLTGSFNTTGSSSGVFVDGDFAYVTDEASGLQIINVSNPAAPALTGTFNTPGSARSVVVAGDRAFVADGSSLQIINVSNPAAPALLGSFDTPPSNNGVAVAGNLAFLANSGGLQCVDITNPAAPVVAGSFAVNISGPSVAVAGDRAYLGGCNSNVRVIDISDPTNPQLESMYTVNCAIDIVLDGDLGYIVGTSFQSILLAQDVLDAARNRGQSLFIDASAIPIVRGQLTSSQSGLVSWEMSANGGTNWLAFQPNGTILKFTSIGSDLRWRTTHDIVFPVVNSVVQSVTFDWLFESAETDLIADVPQDQGGWVRISFGRSGFDFAGDATPVTGYQIYSRVDNLALRERIQLAEDAAAPAAPPAVPAAEAFPGLASLDPSRIRRVDGATYVLGGEPGGEPLIELFPPGVWEVLTWVAARQVDQYVARVPTLGDSTEVGITYTAFLITTHTTNPGAWFVSNADSGYSVDNIAPAPPAGLHFAQPGVLAWNPAPEEDFAYFSVYGSNVPIFDPSATLIGHTVTPSRNVAGQLFGWFHVTTSDHAGNRSGASTIQNGAAGVQEAAAVPSRFALDPGHPNPFHREMAIRLDLPAASDVDLAVFDAAGRHVRTLVRGALPAGNHRLVWDGADERGRQAPAGIYFLRAEAGEFRGVRRVLRLS